MFFLNLREVKLSEDQNDCIRAVLAMNHAVGVAGGRIDDGFTINFVSEFFLNLVGHTEESLQKATGGSFLNLLVPEDRDVVRREGFEQVGGARRYRLLHKNGRSVSVVEFRMLTKTVDDAPGWVISVRGSDDEAREDEPLAFTMDFDGKKAPVVIWGEQFFDFFGEKAEAARENPSIWLDWVHEYDRPQIAKYWEQLLVGKVEQPLSCEEFRVKDASGQYVMLSTRVSIVRNSDGSVRRVVAMARAVDSTSRLSLEENSGRKEKACEAFYRAVSEANHCEFYIDIDTGSYYSFKDRGGINELVQQNSLWPDMIAACCRDFVMQDSLSDVSHYYDVDFIRSEYAAGRSEHAFVSHIMLRGVERWFRHTIIACRPESGDRVDHIVVYLKDETEAERSARSNANLHYQMEEVLAGAGIGAWIIELETGAEPRMYADQMMHRLIEAGDGVTPEACYEAWFTKVFPEDMPIVKGGIDSVLAKGSMEVTYRWKSEKGLIWVRCGGILDKTYTKGIRYKGYHRDVTEIVQREERSRTALKEAYAAARALGAAKAEFLANMSHDIRTPLNGILGMTTIAQNACDDPVRLKAALAKIAEAGQSLTTLLNGILSLSKIESRDDEKDVEFNLKDFLDNTTGLYTVQADTRRQTIRLDASGVVHDRVVAPAGKLRCILSNLIDNAVKYTPMGGTVSITALEHESNSPLTAMYEFVIDDTGIGIEESCQSHLFEPFWRLTGDGKTIQGTGLGLAIVNNLVQQMGGMIALESQSGEGTRCTVTLELKVGDVPDLPAPASKLAEEKDLQAEPDAAEDDAAPVVMVVDDNPLNLEIATEFVRMSGAEPVAAVSGEEAVQQFTASPVGRFSLIFMDIQLPGLSGYEATQAIRASGRADADVPIVALSANTFADDKMRARTAGMNDYLVKPIIQPRLAQMIHLYARKSRG